MRFHQAMLQTQHFLRRLQRPLSSNLWAKQHRSQFSSFHRILAPEKPTSQSAIFVPQVQPEARGTFRESPLRRSSSNPVDLSNPEKPQKNISIDNFTYYGTRILARTGPTSGRSVSCPPGRVRQAISALSKILRDNKVMEEFASYRHRLPPGEKKRQLRRERHRKRFSQGVSRLAGIVMQMRKKRY